MTYVKPVRAQSSVVQSIPKTQPERISSQYQVPAFQALPQSVTKISSGQIVSMDSKKDITANAVYPSNYVKREVRHFNILSEFKVSHLIDVNFRTRINHQL